MGTGALFILEYQPPSASSADHHSYIPAILNSKYYYLVVLNGVIFSTV
jgi:hypothetical protein